METIFPPENPISILDDSKFYDEDETNYQTIGVNFVDPDMLDIGLSPDVHKVSLHIPLEGDYEGKSIAILGAYKITGASDIIQFYKEDITLG